VYKLGKQEPGTPFSKLLDLHLMQQWYWGYFHKKILRLTLIISYSINMHPFLMYTWSGSCILITY
jgi:hypothetical protein